MQVGGAFVLAEKVYSENTLVQEIMTFLYYDFKRKNFSGEEILDKEQDLRMMLRPNTLSQNISLLHEAGFSIVEVIWRCYNFLALLCVKG
jgi:tRNA (cmo5U34)-methyltransferase